MVYKTYDIDFVDLSKNREDLDNLITFGSMAFDPVNQKCVDGYQQSNVGMFLIHSSVFPQYINAKNHQYPVYPSLARGIANNIDVKVYDTIKQYYVKCKQNVEFAHNAVMFNIARSSVFKHKHIFASPRANSSLLSQVFVLRLTSYSSSDISFKLYDQSDEAFEQVQLDPPCSIVFNGLLSHTLDYGRDDNYYGFLLFEQWPE